jgi:hypothetical protein
MIERWVAFWDRREAPESLALLRILVGLVLAWDLAESALRGLIPALWQVPPRGIGLALPTSALPLVLRAFGTSDAVLEALFAVALLGALAVAVGFCLRPAAFGCALATAALAHLAPDGERAIDVLLRTAMLVLALSRADAVWSLSAWLRKRRGAPLERLIPAWPRQLLFLQLVWVYFSAAHNRGGDAWWPAGDFAALSRILSDPHFARFSPGWTGHVYPLTQLATLLTMAFELTSPLLLALTYCDRHSGAGGQVGALVRRFRLRWAWLGLGVCLHLGIAVTMRLGIFPFGMLALYPVLLHPDEVVLVLERCTRFAR